MIGVICQTSEQDTAKEFFELFKTPWEFLCPEKSYDVVLSTNGDLQNQRPKLAMIFGSVETPVDVAHKLVITSVGSGAVLVCQRDRIPLYGNCATVAGGNSTFVTDEATSRGAAVAWEQQGTVFVRAGYDLFEEIRILLTAGQPAKNAEFPTLELHIALIRDVILNSGLHLVEIPPIPHGQSFAVCLTHDVDHPSVRLHKFDHTTAGFYYRALVGSIVDMFKGRISIGRVARNFWAALSLPFVHLGLASDFWLKFTRYLEIERGLGSTFYIIPFKDLPGQALPGKEPQKMRAAKYGIADIASEVRQFADAGCEIGLHGIDAWGNVVRGREERKETQSIVRGEVSGVRMHWLYFDQSSPKILEEAGFSYDSTVGFNETIGFRSGGLQPYKPLNASTLLELPLHIMDTSLFYPSYLNLSDKAATLAVDKLVTHASRFGGALTINWHDRSIAPERLWDGFYIRFIADLKRMNAWFPTAGQAVSWFRERRNMAFQQVAYSSNSVSLKVSGGTLPSASPAFRLRVHKPRSRFPAAGASFLRTGSHVESSFGGDFDAKLEL